MKRILCLFLTLLLCVFVFSGCMKIEDLSDANKIEITKFDTAGDSEYTYGITVEDEEQIRRICENLSSLKLRKMRYNKPTMMEYQLVFYRMGERIVQTISVTAHGWIDYGNDFYAVTDGELDVGYIEDLLNPACEHTFVRICQPFEATTAERCENCGKTRTYPASDDFSFALTWGCYGISSYDSRTGKLVKTTDATHPEDYITSYRLTAEEMRTVYGLITDLDVESYPDEYDPNEGWMSSPSMTLILTVRMGQTEKIIAAKNIVIRYFSEDEKGQRFLTVCKTIEELLTATEEWKALPDYEVLYE